MQYEAFLSYSHKDRAWGDWLHQRLERYKIDRALRRRDTPFGKVPSTLRPIFRDREDFAGGADLAAATRQALEASECLVVICSPNATASRYVNEEIRTFKAIGRAARIIPIIVDGVPGDPKRECFPPALKFALTADGAVSETPVEIIAADARKEADGRDIALQKVVAGLLGIGLDEIRRRAIRAHRRRIAGLGALSVVMFSLAVGAGIAAWVARQRSILAEERLEWALETAGTVTTKVAKFKNKFGVPVPVLAELLGDVEHLLGELQKQSGPSPNLALREARMLDALSISNRDLGNTRKALDQSQQAASKLEFVAEATGRPAATQNDLAWQYMRIGDLMRQQNRLSEAKEQFLMAKAILEHLVGAEPSNITWQDSQAGVLGRLADLLSFQGDLKAAHATADEEVAVRRRLQKVWPRNPGYASPMALSLNRRGTIAQMEDNAEEANESFIEALGLLKPLVAHDPTDVGLAMTLAQTEDNAGLASERLGRLAEAMTLYGASLELRKRISDADPDNVNKLDDLAKIIGSVAYAHQRTGNLAKAKMLLGQQVDIRRKILKLDPADAMEKGKQTIALSQLAYAQAASGDTASALDTVEEGVRLGRELEAAGSASDLDRTIHLIHLGMLVAILDARGATDRTTALTQEMVALSDKALSSDSTNSIKLRMFIISRNMLAAKYRAQDRPRDALDILGGSLRRIEPELSRLTHDIGWLQLAAALQNEIYLSQWDEGDFKAALEAASRCRAYAERWAARDPINRDAQQTLASAHVIFGNASRRMGQWDQAKASHMTAIKIRRDLLAADPNNTSYRDDLAISWVRLGDVLRDQGDYSAALNADDQAIDLRNGLVRLDPSNSSWQSSMATAQIDAGDDLVRLARRPEALELYRAALRIREKLNVADPRNRSLADNLAIARRRVAEMLETPLSTIGEKPTPHLSKTDPPLSKTDPPLSKTDPPR